MLEKTKEFLDERIGFITNLVESRKSDGYYVSLTKRKSDELLLVELRYDRMIIVFLETPEKEINMKPPTFPNKEFAERNAYLKTEEDNNLIVHLKKNLGLFAMQILKKLQQDDKDLYLLGMPTEAFEKTQKFTAQINDVLAELNSLQLRRYEQNFKKPK